MRIRHVVQTHFLFAGVNLIRTDFKPILGRILIIGQPLRFNKASFLRQVCIQALRRLVMLLSVVNHALGAPRIQVINSGALELHLLLRNERSFGRLVDFG